MAKYELNIYGANNEIEKTYGTDDMPWGFYIEAVKAYEEMQEMSEIEQFELIGSFVKRMFIGMTDDELYRAYGDDVMNLFKQLMRKAQAIKANATGGKKNLQTAGKGKK